MDRWQRYLPGEVADEDLRALRELLTGPPEAVINLFHEGLYASEAELPAEMLILLLRLGLIARDTLFPGLIYGTVAILPVDGQWIVCDRGGAPDGSDFPLPPDVVYPPIFDNVRRYLAVLPSTACDALLEIGTGTGIAAILGARYARRVWATDLAGRSVEFARLNCRLAGLENVTVLEGDLYRPVEGLTFDRIAIHPPWIPARQSKFIFGDGGGDGEAILGGSIAGLPRFLRPGGRFYTSVLASDREGETLEQRVRRWLGADEPQFDIAMAELSRDSTSGFLAQNLARGSIGQEDVAFWRELFEATRTEAMIYCYLIVERHAVDREPFTARAPAGSDSCARQLEELLDRQQKPS